MPGVPVLIVVARLGDDAKTVLSTYAHLLRSQTNSRPDRVAAALTDA